MKPATWLAVMGFRPGRRYRTAVAGSGLKWMGRGLSLILLGWFLVACQPADDWPRLGIHTLRAGERMLSLAAAAEFDTVVQLFAWREIEPTPDQFHWEAADQVVAAAEYYCLDLVVRLDQHPAWVSDVDVSLNAPPENLDDYADYVQRVAERYRGRVRAYIIWNEPNLAIEWGGQRPDPAGFTRLLAAGYRAVKAGDPQALVVAAGLAPTNSRDEQAMDERDFLREMYRAGAAAYFDVLAAHPYSFGQPPDAPASDSDHPAFDRLVQLREIMVAFGDRHKPVWITEMGWTVMPPPEQPDIGVSPQQQAAYLVQALDIIRQQWPWVKLVTVWNLAQVEPGNSFGGYSLLDAGGDPRPAYYAWQKAVPPRAERRGQRLANTRRAENEAVVPILGQGVLVHLGDSDLKPPWWPLYAGRKPSLRWTGGFYLAEPGSGDWELRLELMQQNEVGSAVAINGVPLSPDLPQQDFTRRWFSVRRLVPASLLQPGYNEITFTTVRLAPDLQHGEFVWDDFQIKNVRLVSPLLSADRRVYGD